MILHLATFTWKEQVTESAVRALTEALLTMAAGIPEIRSYAVGPNLRLRPSDQDYAVAAIVDDAAGLEAYLDHPLHRDVYDKHLAAMIGARSAAQLPLSHGVFT